MATQMRYTAEQHLSDISEKLDIIINGLSLEKENNHKENNHKENNLKENIRGIIPGKHIYSLYAWSAKSECPEFHIEDYMIRDNGIIKEDGSLWSLAIPDKNTGYIYRVDLEAKLNGRLGMLGYPYLEVKFKD